MLFAICLSTVVLPAFGGRDDQASLALADGAIRSMIREVIWPDFVSSLSLSCGRGALESRTGGVLRDLRIVAVDRFDPQKRVVLLAVLRRPDLTLHLVPPLEAEAADLRHRYIDVSL